MAVADVWDPGILFQVRISSTTAVEKKKDKDSCDCVVDGQSLPNWYDDTGDTCCTPTPNPDKTTCTATKVCGVMPKGFKQHGATYGEYTIKYKDTVRPDRTMVLNCNSGLAHKIGNDLQNVIDTLVTDPAEVKKKCQGKEDQATFYVNDVYGEGKYECLYVRDNDIQGTHIFPQSGTDHIYGPVVYKLIAENKACR